MTVGLAGVIVMLLVVCCSVSVLVCVGVDDSQFTINFFGGRGVRVAAVEDRQTNQYCLAIISLKSTELVCPSAAGGIGIGGSQTGE